jgi:hypothetical protein
MKKYNKFLFAAILIISIAGTTSLFTALPQTANACGYGKSGGSDYVPQRRNSTGYLAQKSALTSEQAREIVFRHVLKLNPDLEVGNINDAGGFFEAEILSQDKEVVQLLGIDKFSGKLMLLE